MTTPAISLTQTGRQVEFKLVYGTGTRQMLMTPWTLIEYQ